jgi:hypothetical protein
MLGSPRPEPLSPSPTYNTTPRQSPRLAQYPSPRVSPGQAPYLKVAPRVNPRNVSHPRLDPTPQEQIVIPLTPHPSADNAPYVSQGTARGGIFNTFEEEHIMETPTLPRYNTRAGVQQHSAKSAQHDATRVFRPIVFTNTQVYYTSPHSAINHLPMVNAVINQDTGASL